MGIVVLVFGLGHHAMSQNTRAQASLDSSNILIGDQLRFHLELTVPTGSKVTWPMLLDTLVNRIEILRKTTIDTVSSDAGSYTLKQELLITSFDSGYYEIPPIPFRFHLKSDSTNYYTETDPLYLSVSSPEVDEAGDIKPIKPPLHAPLTFAEVAPWLAAGLLLALIVAGVVYYLKRKKNNQPVFQIRQKPRLPAHEVALNALENLKQKKLWQSGRVKDYYSEMTDIVRLYIEERYQVRALEMTTYEISNALKKTDTPAGSRDKLQDVLVSADLVKFAKAQPLPLENDTNLTHCVEFVRETKPKTELRQENETNEIKETAVIN